MGMHALCALAGGVFLASSFVFPLFENHSYLKYHGSIFHFQVQEHLYVLSHATDDTMPFHSLW